MFCFMCGKKLPDKAKFCAYCGEDLSELWSEKEEDTSLEPLTLEDTTSLEIEYAEEQPETEELEDEFYEWGDENAFDDVEGVNLLEAFEVERSSQDDAESTRKFKEAKEIAMSLLSCNVEKGVTWGIIDESELGEYQSLYDFRGISVRKVEDICVIKIESWDYFNIPSETIDFVQKFREEAMEQFEKYLLSDAMEQFEKYLLSDAKETLRSVMVGIYGTGTASTTYQEKTYPVFDICLFNAWEVLERYDYLICVGEKEMNGWDLINSNMSEWDAVILPPKKDCLLIKVKPTLTYVDMYQRKQRYKRK